MRAVPLSTWLGPAVVGLASVLAAGFFVAGDLHRWDVLVEEDFSDPSRGTMMVVADVGRRLQYVDGEYEIFLFEKDSWWASILRSESSLSAMRVEVDGRLLQWSKRSDYYGVGCGRGDDTAYAFGVSPDGRYFIDRIPEGDGPWVNLAAGRATDVIKASEPNRIRAECEGHSGKPTRLRLSVNGRTVGEATGDIASFDAAWLVASSSTSKSIARFDDLVVSKK
jgi:hypothetical protein